MSTVQHALIFREALLDDLAAIVRMLADDVLGKSREIEGNGLDPSYLSAFDAIKLDPNNRLIVADLEGEVVGCMQLTTIPHLTFGGRTRLQIEGVRVDRAVRGQQIGGAMIKWAINFAHNEGCHLVQLTSNKHREEALRFYEALDFEPSHIGFKHYLS